MCLRSRTVSSFCFVYSISSFCVRCCSWHGHRMLLMLLLRFYILCRVFHMSPFSAVDDIVVGMVFPSNFCVLPRTHANNWSEWPYKYVTSLIIIVRAFRAENVSSFFYINCLYVANSSSNFFPDICGCVDVVLLAASATTDDWMLSLAFTISLFWF